VAKEQVQKVGKRQGMHDTAQYAVRAATAEPPESNPMPAEGSPSAQVKVKAAEGDQFRSARNRRAPRWGCALKYDHWGDKHGGQCGKDC